MPKPGIDHAENTPLPVPILPAESSNDCTTPSSASSTSLELETDDAETLCETHDHSSRQSNTVWHGSESTNLPGALTGPSDVQNTDSKSLCSSLRLESGEQASAHATKQDDAAYVAPSNNSTLSSRTLSSAASHSEKGTTSATAQIAAGKTSYSRKGMDESWEKEKNDSVTRLGKMNR